MCVYHADVVDTSLCQLARKLLVMSASSAAIGHIFSSFGLILSKLRNQLGIQKCVKYVSCYGMLFGGKGITLYDKLYVHTENN